MKKVSAHALLALLALTPTMGHSQDGIWLGVQHAPEGSVELYGSLSTTETTILRVKGDEELHATSVRQGVKATQTEILRTRHGEPSKVRITYLQDEWTERATMGGQVRERTQQKPLHGESMIGTLRRGGWSLALEDGRPDEAAEKALARLEAKLGVDPYPDHPVRVGESWVLDEARLQLLFVPDSIHAQGSAELTLTALTEYEGQEVAQIEAHVAYQGVDVNGAEVDVEASLWTYYDLATGVTLHGESEIQMTLHHQGVEDGVPWETVATSTAHNVSKAELR